MEDNDKTTFRALLGPMEYATLDLFELDRYGDGIDGIDNGDSIPYRMVDHVSHPEDASAVGHRSLVGSDYSGGSLVRSNLRVFRAMVAEAADPLPIVDTFGGYGTDGVLLLLDREGPSDVLMELVSVLQGLEDYPLIDDDDHSALEMDDEREAWQNYAARDFRRAIVSTLALDCDDGEAGSDGEALEERLDDTDDDTLMELFALAAEEGNVNGGPGTIHEESGVCFLTAETAKAVDLDSLREFLRRVDNGESIRN